MTESAVTESAPGCDRPHRPFSELRDAGLLWLINKVVFHPRGYALAFAYEGSEVIGWKLIGDGAEAWRFSDADDEKGFAAVEATLREARDR